MTTSVVLPTVNKATEKRLHRGRANTGKPGLVGVDLPWLLGGQNWWIPRVFSAAFVCPLGALLGIFQPFLHFGRIDRDPVRCTDCDLCLKEL